MERKICEQFLYQGLGFPIHLLNVPMIKTRGKWTPDIDYNKLQKAILNALVKKQSSLTGNEIRFIRKYFRKTLMNLEELKKIIAKGELEHLEFKRSKN